MFTVTVVPDNITFVSADGESILDAGLKQKLNLPHSCKNGICASCKCKVVSGSIELDPYNEVILSPAEQENGYTLLCKAHATSDVVLDIPNLSGFPIKMLPAKIESVIKINNTAIIYLKLPANQKFDFYSGQYIEVMLKGKTRSYSLANKPNQLNQLELHIKWHLGGVFSELIWSEELKSESIIRFKGPLGTFKLQKTTNPVILVCTGTGFAPVKAILEEMAANQDSREIHLYWGNRTVDDFYLLDILANLQSQLNLKLTLCLSTGVVDKYFIGYVTKALAADFTNLAEYELYACGNQGMIADVYALATKTLNLLPHNFFSDAFTPSVV